MEKIIDDFIEYLHGKKNTSYNTEISYQRDLKKLGGYFDKCGIESLENVQESDLLGYLKELKNENYAAATIARNTATIRAFFQYLIKCGIVKTDPSENLKPPRIEKKIPKVLSLEEVDRLLSMPSVSSAKGLRDKAMLEVLYATGMRVSELIRLETDDVNLQMGYIVCRSERKERIIPIGNTCRDLLKEYMDQARNRFVKDSKEKILFTNCQGRKMSRQGFWKILKGYTSAAGIEEDIMPHTLRHSFAVHMLQNGADVKSVQEMLGHSDISSTQMYLDAKTAKMRDVYMKSHPRY